MVYKDSFLWVFIVLLLPIIITGCVITPIYYHDWWEYEPIDTNIIKNNVEYVYIPRVRPPSFYRYNDWWYTEPYTIVIFRDSTGHRIREKIPNSHLRSRLNKKRPILKREKDVESIMRDIQNMKRNKNRHNNRRRIKKRT